MFFVHSSDFGVGSLDVFIGVFYVYGTAFTSLVIQSVVFSVFFFFFCTFWVLWTISCCALTLAPPEILQKVQRLSLGHFSTATPENVWRISCLSVSSFWHDASFSRSLSQCIYDHTFRLSL